MQEVGHGLDGTIEVLNEFHAEMRRRGATVLFSFPPYPAPLFERDREQIARIDSTLAARCTMERIDAPGTNVRPWSDFYDTKYHLTGPASLTRTRKIATAMRSRRSSGTAPRVP